MPRFLFLVVALVLAGFLAFAGYDVIALVTVFVAFLSQGRTAILPMFQLLGLLFSAAIMLLIFYFPYWYFGDVPLGEFLNTWWFIYFYWVAGGIWSYWSLKRASEETWSVLRDVHSSPIEFDDQSESLYVARGFLVHGDEFLPVDTAAVETGVILVRPHGDALHIPWGQIQSFGLHDAGGHSQAQLEFSRSFAVRVPWRADFGNFIPDEFKEQT